MADVLLGLGEEERAIAILGQILLVKNRGRQVLTDAKEDKA